ncbi:Predicted exporter of the RND superfamily [hydrothermal vent metagenome]|uniref:Predicted exporter of the RND superfamily n=1 Tax=hydrothermal vent metagenome TaxID=652676 RepID=A0A3B1A521_9ZZZZ
MKNFEANFGKWVLKFRLLIIPLVLIVVAIAASGGKNLSMSTNYRVFFSPDNPQLLAFEALEATYAKNDNVLFVLSPKDGNVFTQKTLTAVEDLTKRAWQLPYSLRVDSISNFQYTEAEGDDLIVRDLVEDSHLYTYADLQKVKNIALKEPLLKQRLISKTGDVTSVTVTIQLPGKNETTETPEVVAAARAIAEDIRKQYPHLEVRLTGMIMMNNAFAEASMDDIKSLVPLSYLIMIIMLALLIRDYHGGMAKFFGLAAYFAAAFGLAVSGAVPVMAIVIIFVVWFLALFYFFPGTITTLMVIVLSIMTSLGIFGHMGMLMSPPTTTAPIIILTVAIANCVHILVTMMHEIHSGSSKEKAIIESLRVNIQPIFLASVTTAIGFLTMNFSEVPPFQHLGNLVAMGVLMSLILSLTFLPAVISFFPIRAKQTGNKDMEVMAKFGDYVVEHRRQLFIGMLVLIVVTISFLPKNELNDVFVNYFDESIQFRADTDYTTERLTGIYLADYSLESGTPNGISDPAFLQQMEAFAKWYQQNPNTVHINTITDVMKRLNKNLHGDDETMYKLPKEHDLAAQYLLLYEMSLPRGLDLNNQINIDKSATRFTVTLKTMSSNDIITLTNAADEWLKKNAPAIKVANASGPTVMFANIGSRNIRSMLLGTTVALVLISLILIFALRSVKIGLISMIPNLVPAAMGFGLWGLLVGEVGLALSVVTTMTLGIVVDDTVHFLSKYLRARREKNLSSPDAVRYAFKTVGMALITTSIILVFGFLVLSMSNFELNSSMGLLTSIVIVFALLADLLFLPPLLMKIEGARK